MSKYNILYFTKNMDSYTGASYQREILKAMRCQFNVCLYGPDTKSTIQKMILCKLKKLIKT